MISNQKSRSQSGATQAIATAISTVVCPGDEVLAFEPTYDACIVPLT